MRLVCVHVHFNFKKLSSLYINFVCRKTYVFITIIKDKKIVLHPTQLYKLYQIGYKNKE